MTTSLSFLDDYQGHTILVAPLNWGLGHAARCLPIIRLLQKKNRIIVASDGVAHLWLSKELPEVEQYTLPSYDIRYNRKYMWLSMASQLNHIHRIIRSETAKTRDIVKDHNIDLIISDHRLGVRMPGVTSILIAHQLLIPFRISWISQIITFFHLKYVQQFTECWVPDYEEPKNLSGQLSSPILDIKKRYIDPLSRFQLVEHLGTYDYDLAIVLSGPEPTRTQLEVKLISILEKLSYLRVIMIRGTTEQLKKDLINPNINIKTYDLADSELMQKALAQSAVVLCRSGYSSIMDLDRMQKDAVMIPTPGHPEQEYLARWLSKENHYSFLKESDLCVSSLKNALADLQILSK